MANFKTRSRGLKWLARGTNQQTNTGLFHLNSSLSGRTQLGNSGTGVAMAGAAGIVNPDPDRLVQRVQGYDVSYARIQNRSSAALSWYGFGGRLPNYMWQAGLVDDGVYTDDTVDAQDTDANDFPMAVNADNNTGFAILSKVPFNVLSINVGTQDGGTQTGALKYSIGTGSTLATLTNPYVAPPAQWASGENIVAWEIPTDWVVTDGTELTGVPSGYYMMVVEETTASATAGLATAIEVFYFPWQGEVLADNAVAELVTSGEPVNVPYADALVVGVSTITAIQSSATLTFRPGASVGGA